MRTLYLKLMEIQTEFLNLYTRRFEDETGKKKS
jgi:hypothetical protein